MASEPGASVSWPRAVGATAAIVAVAVGLLVVVRLGGLDRAWRAGLATIWFLAMLAVLAWLLRRLQARHLI